MNPNLQLVSRFNGAYTAWSPRQYDVSGEQGDVGGDEADQLETIENQLTGQRVLPQLTVLKELNGQFVGVDLCFYIGPQGREGVKGLGSRPLALGVLNGPIADILG